MSGLVAIASSGRVSSEILSNATKTLIHRGPDALHTWISPRMNVGLGIARLDVVDLAAGNRALTNDNEKIRGIVDGAFYEHERIQRTIAGGVPPRPMADSEVLVRLYQHLGISCLQHLHGDFAFVLWDERNQLMIAARDRLGTKPLCYAHAADTLYLASEAKAILAAGFPARWDHDTFYQEIHGAEDPTRTLFSGIYRVPPGHYLVLRGGHLRIERYWDCDFPKEHDSPLIADDEHIRQLRDALNEAVRLRLAADVPLGVYLSGGVDSSCVLGMAAQHVSNVNAFTACFPESAIGNEEAVARDSSARFGANLRCYYASKDAEADNMAEAIYHWEDLARSPTMVSKYLLSRFVRNCGVKVVLDGEGAGALFSHLAEPNNDDLLAGRRATRALNDPGSSPGADGLAVIRRLFGFVPADLASMVAWIPVWRPLLSSDFANRFSDRDLLLVHLSQLDLAGPMIGREPSAISQYIHHKTAFPAFFLTQAGDRSQMAHSIEGRHPFLDDRVVDLIHRMPYSVKTRDGVDKYVLREAGRPYITEAVYRRGTQAFPFGKPIDFDRGRLAALMQETLRGPTLAAVPFFDRRRIIDILDQRPTISSKARVTLDRALFRILGTCLLQEQYRLQ